MWETNISWRVPSNYLDKVTNKKNFQNIFFQNEDDTDEDEEEKEERRKKKEKKEEKEKKKKKQKQRSRSKKRSTRSSSRVPLHITSAGGGSNVIEGDPI